MWVVWVIALMGASVIPFAPSTLAQEPGEAAPPATQSKTTAQPETASTEQGNMVLARAKKYHLLTAGMGYRVEQLQVGQNDESRSAYVNVNLNGQSLVLNESNIVEVQGGLDISGSQGAHYGGRLDLSKKSSTGNTGLNVIFLGVGVDGQIEGSARRPANIDEIVASAGVRGELVGLMYNTEGGTTLFLLPFIRGGWHMAEGNHSAEFSAGARLVADLLPILEMQFKAEYVKHIYFGNVEELLRIRGQEVSDCVNAGKQIGKATSDVVEGKSSQGPSKSELDAGKETCSTAANMFTRGSGSDPSMDKDNYFKVLPGMRLSASATTRFDDFFARITLSYSKDYIPSVGQDNKLRAVQQTDGRIELDAGAAFQ